MVFSIPVDQWPALSVSVAFIAAAIWFSRRGTKHNLPPRVPGLPIVGNARDMIETNPLRMDAWKNKYGPLYTLSALGQLVVVVSSASAASVILDKMSAATSSRPHFLMLSWMTSDNLFIMQEYNEKWRRHRRGAHEVLRVPDDFCPVQENEARLLVCDLASGKGTLAEHLRRQSASTIWRTMYGGAPLKLYGEKSLDQVTEMIDTLARSFGPGGGLVDLIPGVKHIPTCLAPFKQFAYKYFARADGFFKGFADEAIKRKLSFNDPTKLNLCAMLDEQKAERELSHEDIAWICGSIYIAGTETTSATMSFLVMALVLHPEVQRKAREELDAEVGDRPPTFSDRDRLPYIEALVKEVLRWRPVAAFGASHVVTEDIVYDGYTIPKGIILLPNQWSITRDPTLFDDPEEFKPERFLESEIVSRPKHVRYDDLGFGFGRRICVGRQIAMSTLFVSAATLLWAFEFHKDVDDNGIELTPSSLEFFSELGTISPRPFPYKLKLRSPQVLERIRATL